MARDEREHVLSFGLRGQRRSASQNVAMPFGKPIEPWDVLEMNLMSLAVATLTGEEYFSLDVDKASKLMFTFPLPSKQANGVAHHLLQPCLTSSAPKTISADSARELPADVIQSLC